MGIGNKGKERFFIVLSVLTHLVVLMIWITFVPVATEPVTKSVKVFSGSVSFNYPKPPPSPRRKTEIKELNKSIEKPQEHALSVAPVEAPKEIKPELPVLSALPEEQGEDGGVADGMPGGVSGGVAGGKADGIPGGTVGQSPSIPSQEPIKIRGDINPPKRIKYAHPAYPPVALMARIEGVVVVEAIIGKDGKIKSARVVRSAPLFDEAALKAVKRWEYTPMVSNGEVREVQLTVTINFKLA